MIKITADSVDQDLYIYDTGLTFGQEFCEKVLNLVKSTPEIFPVRKNYERGMRSILKRAGKEDAREIFRRYELFQRMYPSQTQIDFKQMFLTDELKTEFLNIIPNWVKSFTKEGPDFMLQVGNSGDILYPHKGHRRTCSMFMLLESDGQETRWYRNTKEFKVIDAVRIPDMDCVEQVISAVIEPNKWYVFNHREWHSVHKYTTGKPRINIGIDFNDVSATELVKLIKSNEHS